MSRYKFMRWPEGKLKAASLSYDDGCRQDIRFSELLCKYGVKCTFNINSSFVSAQNGASKLSYAEINEHILDKGHEVAVHGANHRANALQRTVDGIRDVLDCRRALESNLGLIVRGMAYPDSGIRTRSVATSDYDKIKQYLEDLGIVYSRTLGGDNDLFDLPLDWHAWMPTAHHANPHIFEYVDKFVATTEETQYFAKRVPKLFYLWGHSYEFDKEGGWEHIEGILKRLGGKNDTWYATNIEIYDYVKAYEALQISVDEKIIYNPSLITVWMWIDGKIVSVAPGETLRV